MLVNINWKGPAALSRLLFETIMWKWGAGFDRFQEIGDVLLRFGDKSTFEALAGEMRQVVGKRVDGGFLVRVKIDHFVLPTITVTFIAEQQGSGRIASVCAHWLLAVRAHALTMRLVGLVSPVMQQA